MVFSGREADEVCVVPPHEGANSSKIRRFRRVETKASATRPVLGDSKRHGPGPGPPPQIPSQTSQPFRKAMER